MIPINQKLNYSKFLYFALFLNIIGYLALYLLGDFRTHILTYLLMLVPIYIGYFIIVYFSLKISETNNKTIISIFIVGFIVRMILLPSYPLLSDDVFRYLWDGKVFANGFNPYSFAPSSEILRNLWDTDIFPFINFPEIPTVYPPISQLIFLISYLIGYKIFVWKIILFVFESVLLIFLFKLIDHFSLNRLRISIFILNPIVIIETYGSGHLEVIGISFFIMAMYYFYKKQNWAAVFAFILSILVKYKPILLILPFLYKKFYKKIAIISGLIIIALIPFALNGTIPTAGLISYSNRWEFNGLIYKVLVYIFDGFGINPMEWFRFSYNGRTEIFYLSSSFYCRIIALIGIIAVLTDQMKKLKMTANFQGINYLHSSFIVCAAMLLLSPTLYPWYLMWIIPFLIFLPNWSWLMFTFLIQLSYFVLQDYSIRNVWKESEWVLFFQYIPFYSLLIFEYFDRRKIKGWFL